MARDAVKKGRVGLIDEQIGCGYCKHEESCKDRNPKVNKARQGCKRFKHYTKGV